MGYASVPCGYSREWEGPGEGDTWRSVGSSARGQKVRDYEGWEDPQSIGFSVSRISSP